MLSPYRAQAALIRRLLKKEEEITDDEREDITVDTIDRMQGQEREVIIVTLVAGAQSYVEKIADFLYNPNKLNVAFSRAKSKLIIVGNLNSISALDQEDYPYIPKILNSKHLTILGKE